MNLENMEQSLIKSGSIYSKGIFYMHGHSDLDEFKNCYEWIFEQGEIEKEIQRLVEKIHPERIMILIRAYIYKLVARKNDFRKGWKMIVLLLNYIKSENLAVANIYKNQLNKLIGKDYYSDKIKNIVKEISNARK